MIDHGMNPQQALDHPRVYVEPDGSSSILLEDGFPEGVAHALASRGFKVQYPVSGRNRAVFGRGQVVWRTEFGSWCGGSDPRADGAAVACP